MPAYPDKVFQTEHDFLQFLQLVVLAEEVLERGRQAVQRLLHGPGLVPRRRLALGEHAGQPALWHGRGVHQGAVEHGVGRGGALRGRQIGRAVAHVQHRRGRVAVRLEHAVGQRRGRREQVVVVLRLRELQRTRVAALRACQVPVAVRLKHNAAEHVSETCSQRWEREANFKFTPSLTGRKEMFYLMMHSTHFIYSYMASDIW